MTDWMVGVPSWIVAALVPALSATIVCLAAVLAGELGDRRRRARWRLVVISPEGDRVDYGVRPREALCIGREDAAGIPIRDPHVSRRHALVTAAHDGLGVRDLHSLHGSRVNGVPVEWAWLADGDCIYIGSWTILVRQEPSP
ncbi:MAG: FHA domain-containing protein [Candidatus Schekmanbacteria bacterium]|nr:FHA domain-containing protein [Candidatus Schekmanbacteria bacterium]